jgi:hypothetical protein
MATAGTAAGREIFGHATASPHPPRNSAFHFVHRGGAAGIHMTLVLRGVCTPEHRERLERSLSGGRWFLPALVGGGDELHGGDARASCEFVALHPTPAEPTDPRSVGSFVAEMEAAALHGWNHRPQPSAAPAG